MSAIVRERPILFSGPMVRRLERLGYVVEWRILNAADFGDATTRQRFFLLGRKDGEPIAWPTASHAKQPWGDVKRWRAAREIIDWSLKGRSIFGRKKSLSPKTLARIYAGAKKFKWPEPFLVILRQHMDGQSVDAPVPTLCAGGTHVGLAQPVERAPRQGSLFGLYAAAPPAYDILFRMLDPRELARAHSFDDDETTYEFVGNKTEITRQIGGSVPVRTACALVGSIFGGAPCA